MSKRKIPVGIEKFKEIRSENFYYVDKTSFIRELLNSWGKVNLFTRPRRFGKSLNMDMLCSFFEIGADPALFEGLQITKEKELCDKYMGQYPVISISLKDVDGDSYQMSYDLLCSVMYNEAIRLQWLLDSDRLTKYDKASLLKLLNQEFDRPVNLCQSIQVLSRLLYKHYNKKVIILIDEYDVPLNKAYQNRYYEPMISLIRSMFSMALKTNEALYFAVLTGCLRISKESIFTGLNNFKVHGISDVQYAQYFGFTDTEVRKSLSYYGMSDCFEEVKEWYNGYHFGRESIYCPWDVLNYISDHLTDSEAEPVLYWANSSGNETVREIIEHSNGTVKAELELLVSGEQIQKEIIPEMTYQDLLSGDKGERIKYLWSLLYNTGYLTDGEKPAGGRHTLKIPNREVRLIFEQQILTWFSKKIKSDAGKLQSFCKAAEDGDAEKMQQIFGEYLRKSISVRDSAVRKGRKESFYHGMLVGILGSEDTWIVLSNPESGEGYSDILVEIPEKSIGCVIEVKYAENRNLDKACREAIRQVRDKQYMTRLQDDGMETIHIYGIACYLKKCRIQHEKYEEQS